MILSLSKDTLAPGLPLGPVQVPGSKSVSNRALLLAAMAPGESLLRGGLEAEDTRWMRDSLRNLGIGLDAAPGLWRVQGGRRPAPTAPLWLGASGTSLRFLFPWLALQADAPAVLQGEARLFERPLGPLLQVLQKLGANWVPTDGGGILHPCPFPPHMLDSVVDGGLSSQFLSGLAMAAASLPGGGRLRWSSPVASFSYLGLTARWLEAFGAKNSLGASDWVIEGGGLRPQALELPADWSGAAAFLAAAAVTGRSISMAPLDPQDEQSDKRLIPILQEAGCGFRWDGDRLHFQGPLLRGIHANLETCPDLGPVLAATAALAPEPSELTGLQTLPLKECDRLEASADLVRWLGGRAEIEGDHTLRVWPGTPQLHRPPYDPRRDHRMAFAAAVGGLRWGGDLADPGCVAKTFPEFWAEWNRMLQGPP
jgi:3-phosphoshikimate 1-carboxyvinyltransferase